MNKHIELVGKWLADNNSVSLEELKANRYAASTVYLAARAAYAADAYAADAAATAADAAYYVKEYKELTK